MHCNPCAGLHYRLHAGCGNAAQVCVHRWLLQCYVKGAAAGQALRKGVSTKCWPIQACGVYALCCGVSCSKPKVCSYLERKYMGREKKRPDMKALKVSDVWADAAETFALTMLRYHSKSPQELRPYIKASDPAFMAVEPWANLLWLGLGAPPPVFNMVRVCAASWS